MKPILLMLSLMMSLMFLAITANVIAAMEQTTMNFPVIDDAKISSSNPDSNYGNIQLRAGVEGSTKYRTYLKFDISKIPETSVIQDATLSIHKFGGDWASTVNAYRVLNNSWDEDVITWNNAPIQFSNVISSVLFDSAFNTKFMDVTQGIADSLGGDGSFSAMLRAADESANDLLYHLLQNKEQGNDSANLEVIFLTNPPAISQVNAPANANEGDAITISFTASDPDNNIALYRIYFDNELIANSSSTAHTINFEDSGIREIRVYTEDETGLPDTEIRQISVGNVQHLKINEMLPIPGNEGGEWVEVYNPTNSPINLFGCYLRDGYGIITPLNRTLDPRTFGIANVQFLTDTGDIVILYCNGTLIDRVSYGAWNDSNITDNAPLPRLREGVGRVNDGVDTDIDINDFRIYAPPTQGQPNNPIQCEDADLNCDGCIQNNEYTLYQNRWIRVEVSNADYTRVQRKWITLEGC